MHSYKLADLGLRSAPSNTSYWVFPSRFFSPAEAPKLPTLFFSDWTVPSSIKGRLQPWKLSAICNVPCWLGQRLLLKSSLTSLAALFSITDGRPSNQRCFEDKEGPRRGPAFLSRYRRWEVSPSSPPVLSVLLQFSRPSSSPSSPSEANVIPRSLHGSPARPAPPA